MIKFILIALLALALPNMVRAQEMSAVYSPEHCDFSIAFPEEPYSVRRCDDEDEKKCYDLVSFTKVYELNTTVNFKVICNAVGKEVHEQYSGDIMKATLRAMTKDSVVKTFDASFRETENYKQAGLVGEGQVGRTPTIYIGQLWISPTSALSVEAELIGESFDAADTLYSDILKSVHYKGDVVEDETKQESQAEPNPVPAPATAPQNESAQP
jgi:hypothetical protein